MPLTPILPSQSSTHDAVQIYVTRDQQQLGPYSPAEARNRILTGHLGGSDLAWHQGLSSWVTLSEILASVPSHPTLGPIAPTASASSATPVSGFAIASLVAAIIGAIGWIILLVVAIVADRQGRNEDKNDPVMLVFGLMMLFGMILNILGGIGGIAALMRSRSHKWMAITGLIFNALELIVVFALLILGMAMKRVITPSPGTWPAFQSTDRNVPAICRVPSRVLK